MKISFFKAQSAVSTLRRKTGWGTVPLTIFLIYTTVQIGLVLFFSLYQVGGISRLFDPITAIIVAILLLFSVTSGVVVLCTIRKIAASSPSADPKLLFRTASQLILLSFIELLAVFAFGIVGAIGSTVQNNFPVIYGITVVFDQLNQWVIMAALIAQAKMSTWQLKELATARPVTRAESTGFDDKCFFVSNYDTVFFICLIICLTLRSSKYRSWNNWRVCKKNRARLLKLGSWCYVDLTHVDLNSLIQTNKKKILLLS